MGQTEMGITTWPSKRQEIWNETEDNGLTYMYVEFIMNEQLLCINTLVVPQIVQACTIL